MSVRTMPAPIFPPRDVLSSCRNLFSPWLLASRLISAATADVGAKNEVAEPLWYRVGQPTLQMCAMLPDSENNLMRPLLNLV